MTHPRAIPIFVLAILVLSGLACEPSDYIDDVDATQAAIQETAKAAVAEFEAEAAQAETAVLQTLTAEAQATERARPTGTPTLTATSTTTGTPTPTFTASPTPTPAFAALLTIADDGGDNILCLGGSAVANSSPVADIGLAILSSDATTVTFQLDLPGITDLAAAAIAGLHEVGLGINDPAFPLPAKDPAQIFSGLGNLFLASARFGTIPDFTVAAQLFRDGAWQTEPSSDLVVVMAGGSLQITAPVSYFPAEGTLFIYTSYGGECDTVGLSPTGELTIQFARQASGLEFLAVP